MLITWLLLIIIVYLIYINSTMGKRSGNKYRNKNSNKNGTKKVKT